MVAIKSNAKQGQENEIRRMGQLELCSKPSNIFTSSIQSGPFLAL